MFAKQRFFVLVSIFLFISCVDNFNKEYILDNENAEIYVLNYTAQDVSIIIKDINKNSIIEKNIPSKTTNNFQENYTKLKDSFGEGSVYFTRHGKYLRIPENPFNTEDIYPILSKSDIDNFESVNISIQNQEKIFSSALLNNHNKKNIFFAKFPHTELASKWLQEGSLLFSNPIGNLLIADYEDNGSIYLKNPQYIIVLTSENPEE